MEDKELYRHVLGLEKPWRVDRVQLGICQEWVGAWNLSALFIPG